MRISHHEHTEHLALALFGEGLAETIMHSGAKLFFQKLRSALCDGMRRGGKRARQALWQRDRYVLIKECQQYLIQRQGPQIARHRAATRAQISVE